VNAFIRALTTVTFIAAWSIAPWLYESLQPVYAQPHEGSPHHRRPADIHQYLEHLDRAERDTDQQPDKVVEALDLKPGLSIADVGAGSGYFTRRFIQAVTDKGTVYAIDIEPEMLQYTKDSIARMPTPSTVEYILAQLDNPRLPPQSADVIFLCNVYHHLDSRSAYFSKVRSALKPGGRVVIVDFYHDARSGDVGFPRKHLVPRDTVVEEMADAGFRLTREHEFLPRQYFLEFSPAP
jgi:ubiquinone/menaquinone biosynthesis C-methylase UbiE